MSRFSSVVTIVLGSIVSIGGTAPGTAAQQSPFKPPSNLRVLPKDTKLPDLISTMRNFTQALGVRCQFCHSYTGSDPNALENFDFASDSVPAKATARKMMSMLQTINGELLKDVGQPAPAGQMKVNCFTCHRGERTPQTARAPGF